MDPCEWGYFQIYSKWLVSSRSCIIKAQVYLLLMKNEVFVLAGMAFWLPNCIRLSTQWSAFTGHRRTFFHQLPVSRLMESPGAAAGGCNVLSSHRRLFQTSRVQGDVVFTCKAACLRLRFHIVDFCVRLSDMNMYAATKRSGYNQRWYVRN